MIRALPTLVRLRAARDAVTARRGKLPPLRFTLDRTASFTGAMELEMLAAPGFSAEKVRIDAGASEAVMKVRVDEGVKQPGGLSLRFRATGKQESGGTVVSSATVSVKLE